MFRSVYLSYTDAYARLRVPSSSIRIKYDVTTCSACSAVRRPSRSSAVVRRCGVLHADKYGVFDDLCITKRINNTPHQ